MTKTAMMIAFGLKEMNANRLAQIQTDIEDCILAITPNFKNIKINGKNQGYLISILTFLELQGTLNEFFSYDILEYHYRFTGMEVWKEQMNSFKSGSYIGHVTTVPKEMIIEDGFMIELDHVNIIRFGDLCNVKENI